MSLCCLNECEVLMGKIEGQVQAPTTTPEQLIGLVGNLSSSSVEAPRRLPTDLIRRLRAIGARSGGQVPLYGRLFAEWLHVAFPHDCPFPHAAEDAAVHRYDYWESRPHLLSAAELESQARPGSAGGEDVHVGHEDLAVRPWVEEEVLHIEGHGHWAKAALARSAQVAQFLALCGVLFRLVWATLSAVGSGKGRGAPVAAWL